jgi:RNA-directed DNA polymerase
MAESGNIGRRAASKTEVGTPPRIGGIAAANAYLHYVFEYLSVQQWRKHRATGEVIVVRYADDSVLGFQYRSDAELPSRLAWSLTAVQVELHSDKTRLIEFGRFAAASRKQRGEGKPETFDFLGFTHICEQSRKNGKFLVLRKIMRKRLLTELKEELRQHWHESMAELGRWFRSVVQGYFNYHAVSKYC